MSDLATALEQLGNKVRSINDKVSAGKEQVIAYKTSIIEKLHLIVEQLNNLKNSDGLKSIPGLRNELMQSKNSLQQKTEELNKTQEELKQSNATIDSLRSQLNGVEQEMKRKEEEIANLQNSNEKLTNELNQKIQEYEALKEEKNKIEIELNNNKEQIANLANKINEINSELSNNVDTIQSIAGELGNVDSGEMAVQFQAITQNISEIINMINNPNAKPTVNESYNNRSVYEDFSREKKDELMKKMSNADREDFYKKLNIYLQNPKNPSTKGSVDYYLKKYNMMGGRKMRRKTMRKKKSVLRGGYVYSTSKPLDNASSIISVSSSTKSKLTSDSSLSKTKSKNKSRSRSKSLKLKRRHLATKKYRVKY